MLALDKIRAAEVTAALTNKYVDVWGWDMWNECRARYKGPDFSQMKRKHKSYRSSVEAAEKLGVYFVKFRYRGVVYLVPEKYITEHDTTVSGTKPSKVIRVYRESTVSGLPR